MAVILNPTYSANNSFAEFETMTIDDSTGVYDNPDNLGGYGSPNAERNTLGLILLVEKKGYGNIADAEITYDNSSNTFESIATWDVTIAVDGWFKNTLLAFPKWLVGETYDASQAVYLSDVVYLSVAGGNIGNSPPSAEWTIADTDDYILIRDGISTYSSSHTIFSAELDKIITGLGDIGYGDAVASDLAKDCAAECYDDINETNKIWAYLEGSKIAGSRSKFMEGERKVLVYTDLIAGKDCKIC